MKNDLFTVSFYIMMTGSLIFSACKKELTFHASGKKGVVAAGAPESALAGAYILSRGGNAVDAAVATIFNLAVSDYGYFCIGGEVPFIFFSTDEKKVTVFNGMGSAPLDTAAVNWYYQNGIPKTGIRSSTVPSAVSTCLTALGMKGTMSFDQVIAPTLELLDKGGQDWYPRLAATLRKLVETERSTGGSEDQGCQGQVLQGRHRGLTGQVLFEFRCIPQKG